MNQQVELVGLAGLRCIPMHLPMEKQIEAVTHSISINHDNAIPMALAAPGTPPMRIALQRGKLWKPGQTLGIAFLNTDDLTATEILKYMSLWSERANIDFKKVAQGSHDVLLGRGQAGLWSFIGNDALMMHGQQTFNLQNYDRTWPDSEKMRVIPHETGHMLGALHEQQRPEVLKLLRLNAIIARLEREQGWSAAEAWAQFRQMDMAQVYASKFADLDSIMMYEIAAEDTISGQAIKGGTHITEDDYAEMVLMYPPDRKGGPPAPPVPPQLPVLAPDRHQAKVSITVAGQPALFDTRIPAEGQYRLHADALFLHNQEPIAMIRSLDSNDWISLPLLHKSGTFHYTAGQYITSIKHPNNRTGNVYARMEPA